MITKILSLPQSEGQILKLYFGRVMVKFYGLFGQAMLLSCLVNSLNVVVRVFYQQD